MRHVNWAVQAGRVGLVAGPDWSLVFTHMGWLALFTVICTWQATHALRVYQWSM